MKIFRFCGRQGAVTIVFQKNRRARRFIDKATRIASHVSEDPGNAPVIVFRKENIL
jgi:hypothetical protein